MAGWTPSEFFTRLHGNPAAAVSRQSLRYREDHTTRAKDTEGMASTSFNLDLLPTEIVNVRIRVSSPTPNHVLVYSLTPQ